MSDPRLVLSAAGVLREFNEAGVLAAADLHVARRLAELAGEEDEAVTLAAALAVRGPRLGHVYVDVATIRDTVTVDAEEPVDLGRAAVAGRRTTGSSGSRPARSWRWARSAGDPRPLRLVGTLALPRPLLARGAPGRRRPARARRQSPAASTRPRWRRARAAVRATAAPARGGRDRAAAPLRRHRRRPGHRQDHDRGAHPRAAARAGRPAGRARGADRQGRRAADRGRARGGRQARHLRRRSARGCSASRPRRCTACSAGGPARRSRFRHDRGNRLPHDVVIVDETSMVSLSLMARLVEAVRADARLILVGDPGQLTSIEAGAVLGDIVGPAARGDRRARARPPLRRRASPSWREAIRRGDGDARASRRSRGVTWIADPDDALDPVRDGGGRRGPRP